MFTVFDNLFENEPIFFGEYDTFEQIVFARENIRLDADNDRDDFLENNEYDENVEGELYVDSFMTKNNNETKIWKWSRFENKYL